jgi:hypothetical protein
MLKNSFLKFGAMVGSLPVLFLPAAVFAATNPLDAATSNLSTVKTESGITAGAQDLPTLIGRFIGIVIGILGIILVIRIIQAGIMYMTAGGDPGKVATAKKMITESIVGIIIVISAYAISSFVIDQIAQAT